jgi:NADH:ubiquinone oxidoreductase subunit 4 (subunit M)
MTLLIGIWGSGFEKVRAAYYFFFFTFLGSFLFILAIFLVDAYVGTTSFLVFLNVRLPWDLQLIIFFCFFLGFAVKIPLFPLHT